MGKAYRIRKKRQTQRASGLVQAFLGIVILLFVVFNVYYFHRRSVILKGGMVESSLLDFKPGLRTRDQWISSSAQPFVSDLTMIAAMRMMRCEVLYRHDIFFLPY